MTKEELDGIRIFVIHDFLSQAECGELIRSSESLAWEAGTVGGKVASGVRNNERVKAAMLDEIDLTIDGTDGAKLLGLIIPLTDGKWGFCLNLPGKTRPADTVSADLSYYWQAAK